MLAMHTRDEAADQFVADLLLVVRYVPKVRWHMTSGEPWVTMGRAMQLSLDDLDRAAHWIVTADPDNPASACSETPAADVRAAATRLRAAIAYSRRVCGWTM